MKKYYCIVAMCVTLLLFSQQLNSQNVFQDGWIINNNGDTLFGKIKLKEWTKTPEKVTFLTQRETVFQVKSLQGFGVKNDIYFYKRFPISKHLLPISEIEDLPEDSSKTDSLTVWLKILVNGKASLGQYINDNRVYYYYIIDNVATELIYSKGQKNFTEEKYFSDPRYLKKGLIEDFTFRQQLFNLNISEKSLTNISEEISKVEYNAYSLENTFNRFNNLKTIKAVKGKNHFYISAGITNFSTSVTGSTFYIGSDAVINNSSSPFARIGFDLGSGNKYNKLNFLQELGFLSYNTTGTKGSNLSNGFKYEINNTFLSGMIGLKYTFKPLSSNKIYGKFGVNALFAISQNNKTTETSLSGTVITTNNVPEIKSNIFSPMFEIGATKNRVSLFVNYAYSANITKYASAQMTLNMFFFGLSYSFKK